MVAVVLALVGLIAVAAVRARGTEFRFSGPQAPAFSFRYQDLERARPAGSEIVRLEQSNRDGLRRRFTVQPLALPPRQDPLATSVPFAAEDVVRVAAKRHAGFRLTAEGFTRLAVFSGQQSYMVAFTARGDGPRSDGGVWLGKILILPAPGDRPHRALQLQLLERVTSPDVLEALHRFPAGFLLNWPIRFWLQHRTSVDVPPVLERPLKTFSIG